MGDLVSQRGVKILEFMNTSPIFKGIGTIIVGILALLFAYYMVKKWNEPKSIPFKIFIGLAIFVILYGVFILSFQPAWWIPTWWE